MRLSQIPHQIASRYARTAAAAHLSFWIQTWCSEVMLLGLTSLFLLLCSFAGYVSRGCSQPKEVDLTLRLLVSAAPVALILIGLGILYSYPIDEERRQYNHKMLQEMRWSPASPRSAPCPFGCGPKLTPLVYLSGTARLILSRRRQRSLTSSSTFWTNRFKDWHFALGGTKEPGPVGSYRRCCSLLETWLTQTVCTTLRPSWRHPTSLFVMSSWHDTHLTHSTKPYIL